jgi:hypothetical protein
MHILPISVILYIYRPNIKAARNDDILISNSNSNSNSGSGIDNEYNNGNDSLKTN